jgi:hypothetical protein
MRAFIPVPFRDLITGRDEAYGWTDRDQATVDRWIAAKLAAADTPEQTPLQAPVSGGGNPSILAYPYPRIAGHYGDSLTADTGATLPFGYVKLLQDVAGSQNILATSIKAGVGGEKMDQIVARMLAGIAAYDIGFLWGGTNDALSAYPLERTTQAIKRAALAHRAAGKPLVCITPASTYGATFGVVSYTSKMRAIRDWIVANAPALGMILVDLWPTMVDPSDNTLRPQFQSGDGVHENSESYLEVVRLCTVALTAAGYLGVNYVRDAAASNLCSNPGNAGTGALPTGATQASQSGTASTWTRSLVADTTGALVAGSQWHVIDADATSGAGNLQIAYAGALINSTQVMAANAKIFIEDVNGTTLAQMRANSGYIDYGVSLSNIIQGGQFLGGVSVNRNAEQSYRFTAASSSTHRPHLIINLASGQRVRVWIGDVGFFNLSASGLL